MSYLDLLVRFLSDINDTLSLVAVKYQLRLKVNGGCSEAELINLYSFDSVRKNWSEHLTQV